MFSYKEFPEQVTSEMNVFAAENQFELFRVDEDHCVRYRNKAWELNFFCDHGAVELSIVSLEDGYSYSLINVLRIFFPTSKYVKQSSNYIWGSLETVRFNVDSLKEHFNQIDLMYPNEKDRLRNNRDRSTVLIDFVQNHASQELKNEFEWSNNLWLEKASGEYAKYKNGLVNIDVRTGVLTVRLIKATDPNVFHIFAAVLLGAGHIMIALFIFNSIWNDGIIVAKIVFVILGLVALGAVNMQFRRLLLLMKGQEEIRIDDDSITYTRKFGLIKKLASFKNDEIQKLELVKLGNDQISQSSKMFLKIKYGTIVINKSNRISITFGQSLDRQDLELVYNALKQKINLTTESNID